MADPISLALAYAFPTTLGTVAFTAGTTAVTWATVASTAITAAALTTAAVLAANRDQQGAADNQIVIKQARPSRRRHYGRVKVAGALMFVGVSDIDAGTMYQMNYFGEGPWQNVVNYWLNDTKSNISGNSGGLNNKKPWVDPDSGGLISIEMHMGVLAGETSAALMTAFPSEWTSAHLAKGLVNAVISYAVPERKTRERTPIFYPSGAPALRIEADTALVFDPRTSTTGFSKNAALCIRDYLTHPQGFRLSASMMDDSIFSTKASLCGQNVPLKAGGTEPRYQLCGSYDLVEEPKDVLRKMLAVCDGELFLTGAGLVGLRGGQYIAPTVHFGDDVIQAPYVYRQGNQKLSAFNELKISYSSPDHDYQPTETVPWSDLTNQTERGEVITEDFPLEYCPSNGQAQRLAKIKMAKANPQHILSFSTGPEGLEALDQEFVSITLTELGIINQPFRVEGLKVAGDLSRCQLLVSSISGTPYGWDAATEEQDAPPVPNDTNPAVVPPTLTGVSVRSVLRAISANTNTIHIQASVAAPADTRWQFVGQYRMGTSGDWLDMVDDGRWVDITPALVDGAAYQVRVGFADFSGDVSIWSSTYVVVANANPGDDLTTWTGSATVTAVPNGGPGGVTAYDITDNSASLFGKESLAKAVPANNAVWICEYDIKKGTVAPPSSPIRVDMKLTGGTAVSTISRMNPITGAVILNCTVTDIGNWWRVRVQVQNNGTNTLLTLDFFPAGANTAATGTNRVANVVTFS